MTANKKSEQLYVIFEYKNFAVTATYSEALPYYYAENLQKIMLKAECLYSQVHPLRVKCLSC